MDPHHYIATTYLKLLLNEPQLTDILSRSFGEDYAGLFEKEFLDAREIDSIFAGFLEVGLDSWVLRYGSHMSVGAHGPLGFAVMSAPDLHTALNVLADYSVTRTSTYRNRFEHRGNRIFFISEDQTGKHLADRWLIEVSISVAQRLIESVMAHPLGDNANISFSYSKPDYSLELEQFYGVRCEFDAAENAISIPASWCRISSPLSDPAAFSTNLAKCQELTLRLQGSNDIAAAVNSQLTKFFNNSINGNIKPSALPSLNQLAEGLCLSSRTLTRRLKTQNSSYKIELERVRRQHATDLLSNTHLTVADIAYHLSYQEPANFVRAFKKWFSTTPAAWRRDSSRQT